MAIMISSAMARTMGLLPRVSQCRRKSRASPTTRHDPSWSRYPGTTGTLACRARSATPMSALYTALPGAVATSGKATTARPACNMENAFARTRVLHGYGCARVTKPNQDRVLVWARSAEETATTSILREWWTARMKGPSGRSAPWSLTDVPPLSQRRRGFIGGLFSADPSGRMAAGMPWKRCRRCRAGSRLQPRWWRVVDPSWGRVVPHGPDDHVPTA